MLGGEDGSRFAVVPHLKKSVMRDSRFLCGASVRWGLFRGFDWGCGTVGAVALASSPDGLYQDIFAEWRQVFSSMRMIMYVTFPVVRPSICRRQRWLLREPRSKRILDQLKPEAAYFTDRHGQRSAVLIVDLADASKIPVLAEPFFLLFNAGVEVHPVMLPQDLAAAGLEGLGKQWV